MTENAFPPDLAQTLERYPVVIVRSALTDTRLPVAWLQGRGIEYAEFHFSMGSADERYGFRALQQQLGWDMLPMIFVNGEFVGGEQELYRSALGEA